MYTSKKCPDCNGTGKIPGECPYCHGKSWGFNSDYNGGRAGSSSCQFCGGINTFESTECLKCGGTGYMDDKGC